MKFSGNLADLEYGISQLGICEGLTGDVTVTSGSDKLVVSESEGVYEIKYGGKVEFFRGLAILVDKIKKGEKGFCVVQEKKFDSCGVMLDVSRNAVLKIETIKYIVKNLAKMGLNTVMLYTEDTFKMDKYPHFGYMRGAYTKEEIREIVAYGEVFGIEFIPCIQTLAHLYKTLRWHYANGMRDTGDILLIGEEKTYEFIEEMIKTARECYNTDKIHIGMDEAHDVGRGEYLTKHGYRDRFEILSEHLDRVIQITDKYNFKPMMWSDMFFRLGSKTGDYYDTDAKMPDNISDMIPKELSVVYWDYYNIDEKICEHMIKAHQDMQRNVIFAGGIWTWNGLSPHYEKTFKTTKVALSACRKNNVKDVWATMWGDDGAETSVITALLGMQLYGEFNYFEDVSDEHLAEMFKICTGYDKDAFEVFDIDAFDRADVLYEAMISKQVFYKDVLCGMLEKNHSLLDLKSHYSKILKKFDGIKPQGDIDYLIEYQKQFVTVLYKKCNLGHDILDAYMNGNKDKLAAIIPELNDTCEAVAKLHKLAADIWYKNNKAFGFEQFDVRLSGVETRIRRAAIRIEDYLAGRIDKIEELEEPRLWHWEKETPFANEGPYAKITGIGIAHI